MNVEWQRLATVVALTLLGLGILVFMGFVVARDGSLSAEDGGWVLAGFLSLREVFSKIENVALGNRPLAGAVNEREGG